MGALAATALVAALAGQTVVLDPGHNRRDGAHPERINRQVHVGGGMYKACNTTGAATRSGYSESRFNLAVAREAARILRRRGARVILTRRNDRGVGPCITRRARIANRAEADAAVSIHADGGPPGGHGFHVIRPVRIEGLTDDIARPSRRLGRLLRSADEDRTGLPRAGHVGGDALVARADLGGLRLAEVSGRLHRRSASATQATRRRRSRGASAAAPAAASPTASRASSRPEGRRT